MSMWSLTYQQSVFKRYNSDKNFSEFLPTRWRQKSTGIYMEKITSLSLKYTGILVAKPTTLQNEQLLSIIL